MQGLFVYLYREWSLSDIRETLRGWHPALSILSHTTICGKKFCLDLPVSNPYN